MQAAHGSDGSSDCTFRGEVLSGYPGSATPCCGGAKGNRSLEGTVTGWVGGGHVMGLGTVRRRPPPMGGGKVRRKKKKGKKGRAGGGPCLPCPVEEEVEEEEDDDESGGSPPSSLVPVTTPSRRRGPRTAGKGGNPQVAWVGCQVWGQKLRACIQSVHVGYVAWLSGIRWVYSSTVLQYTVAGHARACTLSCRCESDSWWGGKKAIAARSFSRCF